MVEDNTTFKGEGELNIHKVFVKAFDRAFTKAVEYVYNECYDNCPIAKTRKGAVNIRSSLRWEVDLKNHDGYVGIPIGSDLEKPALYVEFGTGERGSEGWEQYFDEKRPTFTIPIVPKKFKAMHYVTESGKDVYMKRFKGHPPQAFMRRSIKNSKRGIEYIFKQEFSENNIRKLMNKKELD